MRAEFLRPMKGMDNCMRTVSVYSTIFGNDTICERRYETGLIPDEKQVEMQVINLYPKKTYQTIRGFGGALTESAGYALSRMSEEKRREAIAAFYGEGGIGYTIGRVHMDSCDFSLENYCAVEDSQDPTFGDFDLSRDAKYVQPLIRDVSETLGKPVQLLLSPWSPPAFMKENGMRNGGGHLKQSCYQTYADYIAKYITEYKKLGFDIAWMTVQNEPLAVQTWDSCEYTPEEEKTFLREYLYPTLQKKGLEDVALYIWDHNKERAYERTCEIVDETTKDMIAGVAFHWYTGDHFDTLRMVREDFPELELMHSEGCVELARYGAKAGTAKEHAFRYAHDILGDLNNGMNYWIDWNLVLDETGGPNHVDNFCGAPIVCDGTSDTVIRKPMYYAISHFSKYMKPGAVRIATSTYHQQIEVTGAKNPDGTIVVVAMNKGNSTQTVNLRIEGMTTRVMLWGDSISTILLKETV